MRSHSAPQGERTAPLRLFVALRVEAPATAQIERLQRALEQVSSRELAHARYTARRELHITLKFLGSTPRRSVAGLRRSVEQLAQHHTRFEASWAGCVAFPSVSRARVLALGLDDRQLRLARLAADLDRRTAMLGFDTEKRPLHPHVTVARLSRPQDLTALLRAVDLPPNPLSVATIVLFQSRLTDRGSDYEPLLEVPLSKPP